MKAVNVTLLAFACLVSACAAPTPEEYCRKVERKNAGKCEAYFFGCDYSPSHQRCFCGGHSGCGSKWEFENEISCQTEHKPKLPGISCGSLN
jgi:hypothetical protein